MPLLEALVWMIVLLLVTWLLLIGLLWLHRPSRELVGPAIRLVPDLIRLVRRLLADRRTPRSVRLGLVFLLGWLVSPIDLVPEFLPVIGALDDVIVAALILRWAARRVGRDRLRELWPGTEASFALLRRLL